ncbi:hypothetical protein [Halocatena halophila]|uniref:hypothetical protein n=1 Tax=Halocatena halophila TaxID=2814576 RepID=UPI002ED0CB3F
MFDSLKQSDDNEEDNLSEYYYEPDDSDQPRRYEYKAVDIDLDGDNLGHFLNKQSENGWRYIRDIDGEDIGNLGESTKGVSHFFIFERPVREHSD